MDADSTSLRARMKRRLPNFEQLSERIRTRARALRRRFGGTEDASVAERLAAIDEEYVERGAKDITEVDLDTVIEQAEAIEERFESNGPLQRLLEDGRLLLSLVRDARRGHYREIPVWTLSAAGFTLLYVLNPFDLIPDTIPLLGVLDDAAVVSACLSLLEQDLRDYQAWKRARLEDESDEPAEDLISP
ncbi:MAG: YkvA family protein [Salinibacter sp.]|uniref:YkvA family protein n=1 Tax=Salinibacter sp. TaxID=2065818 RepID=UPI0035D42BF3